MFYAVCYTPRYTPPLHSTLAICPQMQQMTRKRVLHPRSSLRGQRSMHPFLYTIRKAHRLMRPHKYKSKRARLGDEAVTEPVSSAKTGGANKANEAEEGSEEDELDPAKGHGGAGLVAVWLTTTARALGDSGGVRGSSGEPEEPSIVSSAHGKMLNLAQVLVGVRQWVGVNRLLASIWTTITCGAA